MADRTPERLEVVTFDLGTRSCAIALSSVREVLRFGPITAVPATPRSIVGATNVAGTVLPVVDLGVILGEGETRPAVGETGLRVAEGDTEVVLSLGRVVDVARLRSAQPMAGRQLAAGGDAEPRGGELTRVLATERGTLHLVDVAAVLGLVNQQVTAAARDLREGLG